MSSKIINQLELSRRLKTQKKEIQKFGVAKIAIFGSYARGEQTKTSDIDLLVEFIKGEKNYDNFIKLAYYLENLFGKKVELVTPESLSPYIKPHIIKDLKYVSFNS